MINILKPEDLYIGKKVILKSLNDNSYELCEVIKMTEPKEPIHY